MFCGAIQVINVSFMTNHNEIKAVCLAIKQLMSSFKQMTFSSSSEHINGALQALSSN